MEAYKAEMVGNFNRKIANLRVRLLNTVNSTARKHIRSSIAILEVELASWQ